MKAKDLELGAVVKFGADNKIGVLVEEGPDFIRRVYIVHPKCEFNPVLVMMNESTHRRLGGEWIAVEPDHNLE